MWVMRKGKYPIDFSMYCIIVLIAWKIQKKSNRILNSGLWMDQVRQVLRYHHSAYLTEQTYCDWIMRYIRYHGSKTHPREMGKKEIEVEIYTHVMEKDISVVRSPLDGLE